MNKNKKRFTSYKNNNQALFTFKINDTDYLLNFLFKKIPVIPRGKIKSMLEHHQILVNGVSVTQYNFQINKDDEVKVVKTAYKDHRIIKPPFDIIYEDDDFVVINKPSGLLTIPSDKENKRTAYRYVSDYVYNHNKKQRIYIVHRLDEDTSGVLVFSKNAKLKDALQERWNEIVLKRKYFAIVEGNLKEKKGRLEHYLKKNSINLVYITDDKKNGKKAITNYEVIKENNKYSLLDVSLETGRQNQIRVQLGGLGHFVIGDDKYGEPSNPLNRLGLHAYYLEFKHPFNHKIMKFNTPMPKEFKNLFNQNVENIDKNERNFIKKSKK